MLHSSTSAAAAANAAGGKDADLGDRKSPLDRFLKALDDHGIDYNRSDGFYAIYACPVHHDKDLAASARVTETGRLLLHCHACNAGFLETLEAVGLKPHDVPSGMSPATGPAASAACRSRNDLASDEHVDQITDLVCEYEDALRRRPDMLAELAARLGVSEKALLRINVGLKDERNPVMNADGEWVDRGAAWVFPEQDHRLAYVGIGTRFVNPAYDKGAVKGSRRGLIIPWDYDERTEGPIFIVEGPSDVAALLDKGKCAVGRPSAAQGGRELVKLLTSEEIPVDPRRPIIIIAENDKKPDGRWPGRDGALRVAAGMRRGLGRDVKVVFPPAGIKDAREWVRARDGIERGD